MSTYSIEVPFAPGEFVWTCWDESQQSSVRCPECEGSLVMVVETKTGRYEVPCETCRRSSIDPPSGYLINATRRRIPLLITLGRPNVEADGRVWYHRHGEAFGAIFYSDKLFRDRDACELECQRLDKEQAAYIEAQNEHRCGRGRTEAARSMSYHKQQIKDCETRLEYSRSRLKQLDALRRDAAEAAGRG